MQLNLRSAQPACAYECFFEWQGSVTMTPQSSFLGSLLRANVCAGIRDSILSLQELVGKGSPDIMGSDDGVISGVIPSPPHPLFMTNYHHLKATAAPPHVHQFRHSYIHACFGLLG